MGNDEEYNGLWKWKLGDPVDDANGGTMNAQNWGNEYYDDDDNDDDEASQNISRKEFFIRKGKVASINGDHLTAIKFYEEVVSLGGRFALRYIADEYEAMGRYDEALFYWDKYCARTSQSFRSLVYKADFLYRIGRYDEAAESYKEALKKMEARSFITQCKMGYFHHIDYFKDYYFGIYTKIIDSYRALGKYGLAEEYRKKSRQKVKDIVDEAKELAWSEMKMAEYSRAMKYCEIALSCDPNNVEAKEMYDECNKFCGMDTRTLYRLKYEAKEKKRREEKRARQEQKNLARKKSKKEYENRKRKRKEECEKNPECLKKEIEHFKKKVLKDYYLLLRFEHYQEKSDIKFKEILEYEELLEKLGVKKTYSKKDLEDLKKENKRIRQIISHVGDEYRENGMKLFVRNQKIIDELEKKYPEKGFIRGLFNEVFDSGCEDIEAFEIEISVRDKIGKVRDLLLKSDDSNVQLQEALVLLDDAGAEISGYLKDKKENRHHTLRNLNNEILSLKEEANHKVEVLIDMRKDRLFLIDRDRYSGSQFIGRPGMDLRLVKEDGGNVIAVCFEDEPVGIVLNNCESDFEKKFCDDFMLERLAKISSAKYFLRFHGYDILEIDESKIKRDWKREQEKILKKYPKDELITVNADKDKIIEFKEGMQLKLIKNSNYDSTGKIGVYVDDEKIGSVSSYLSSNLTTRALDLKDIPKQCHAEYLLKYEDKYHIARIINKSGGQ